MFIDMIIRHYYSAVVSSPDGRIWYHNLYQRLEDTGEVPDLSTCKGKLMDNWLEKLFDRHNADERRHSRLWVELLTKRSMHRPEEIPYWANTVGAFCDAGWTSVALKLSADESIHQAELIPMFAGVHALETLAIGRFQLMADLHRSVDPEISELLDTIIKDEKFHASYTKKAVVRLGRKNNCPEYAHQCLEQALTAYRRYTLTLMPRYVEILRRKGVMFAWWFLAFNSLVKLYAKICPALQSPPQAPDFVRALTKTLKLESVELADPIAAAR